MQINSFQSCSRTCSDQMWVLLEALIEGVGLCSRLPIRLKFIFHLLLYHTSWSCRIQLIYLTLHFICFFFPLICLPQRANLWLMYLSFLRTSNNIWSSLDAKIIFFYIKKEWVERERERRRQKGWEKGKNKIGKENERHKSLILRQPSHSLVNSLSFIKAFR